MSIGPGTSTCGMWTNSSGERACSFIRRRYERWGVSDRREFAVPRRIESLELLDRRGERDVLVGGAVDPNVCHRYQATGCTRIRSSGISKKRPLKRLVRAAPARGGSSPSRSRAANRVIRMERRTVHCVVEQQAELRDRGIEDGFTTRVLRLLQRVRLRRDRRKRVQRIDDIADHLPGPAVVDERHPPRRVPRPYGHAKTGSPATFPQICGTDRIEQPAVYKRSLSASAAGKDFSLLSVLFSI